MLSTGEQWPIPSEGDDDVVAEEELEVIVHTNNEQCVGLVVDQLLDIVEETSAVQRSTAREGVLGTAVIEGRVTELLNFEEIIHIADPVLFNQFVATEMEV